MPADRLGRVFAEPFLRIRADRRQFDDRLAPGDGASELRGSIGVVNPNDYAWRHIDISGDAVLPNEVKQDHLFTLYNANSRR
jgi:hypothetical protein